MQVNSISSQMASKQAFGNYGMTEEQMQSFKKAAKQSLEQFAYMDDISARKMASGIAAEKVNDKKHRKIANAIIYSIPVAAGIAAAIKNPASRIGRLGTFAAEAGRWLGGFLLIDGVIAGKRKVEKHVPAVRKFNNEHPVLAFFGTIATATAALFGGAKLFNKTFGKYITKNGEKIVAKVKPGIEKLAKHLDNSKLINSSVDLIKKAPNAVKNIAKAILNNGHWLLVGSSIVHSTAHHNKKDREAVKSYIEIKESQNQMKTMLNEMDEAETV